MKGWLADNKGQPLSIYNVPYLVAKAYPKAMTPENISAGFKATGIFPHDRHIFPPDAFLPAQVTDRPDPTVTQQSGSATPPTPVPASETSSVVESSEVPNPSVVSTSQHDSPPPVPASVTGTCAPEASSTVEAVVTDPPVLPRSQCDSLPPAEAQVMDTCASATSSKAATPSDNKPFIRAPPRKRQGHSRSGSMRVLADTPVKNDIAMKKQKKVKGKTKSDCNALVQQQSGDNSVKTVKKRLNYNTADTVPHKRKCSNKLTLSK